jgi:hypothetical protein
MKLLKRLEGKEAAELYGREIQPGVPLDFISNIVEAVEIYDVVGYPNLQIISTTYKQAKQGEGEQKVA